MPANTLKDNAATAIAKYNAFFRDVTLELGHSQHPATPE
jgi:hypothetical protein